MGAIGDYVHLHRITYIKFGTTKNGTPDFYKTNEDKSTSQINLATQYTHEHANISKEDLNALANNITSLISKEKVTTSDTSTSQKKLIKALQQRIEKETLEDMADIFKLNWTTGNVTFKSQQAEQLIIEAATLSKLYVRKDATTEKGTPRFMKASTIIPRIEALFSFVQHTENFSQMSEDRIQKFQTAQQEAMMAIKTLFSTIIGDLKVDYSDINNIPIIRERITQWLASDGVNPDKVTFKYTNEYNGTSVQKLLNQINEALGLASANKALNQVKGRFLEVATKYASLMPSLVDNLAETAADEKIEEIVNQAVLDNNPKVIGDNRVHVKQEKANFSSDVVPLLDFPEYTSSEDGSVLVSKSTSQNKTDVIFQWLTDLTVAESQTQQKIKVSNKNYNLSSKNSLLSLVSGTSLLYLLQQANSTTVNHFLNIATKHQKMSSKEKTPKKGSLNGLTTSFIDRVHKSLELFMIMEALTGNIGGRDDVGVLLVNDNSKKNGGVRAINMSDLLVNLEKDQSNQIIKIDNQDGLKKLRNTIPNDRAETKEARIAKVLASVREKKVYIKMKPSLLKKSKYNK